MSLNSLEEIEKLFHLKAKGIISEEEFQNKKNEILQENISPKLVGPGKPGSTFWIVCAIIAPHVFFFWPRFRKDPVLAKIGIIWSYLLIAYLSIMLLFWCAGVKSPGLQLIAISLSFMNGVFLFGNVQKKISLKFGAKTAILLRFLIPALCFGFIVFLQGIANKETPEKLQEFKSEVKESDTQKLNKLEQKRFSGQKTFDLRYRSDNLGGSSGQIHVLRSKIKQEPKLDTFIILFSSNEEEKTIRYSRNSRSLERETNGSSSTLETWSKITDDVIIEADNSKDGFPMNGTYRLENR